jgi:hypothetical protein
VPHEPVRTDIAATHTALIDLIVGQHKGVAQHGGIWIVLNRRLVRRVFAYSLVERLRAELGVTRILVVSDVGLSHVNELAVWEGERLNTAPADVCGVLGVGWKYRESDTLTVGDVADVLAYDLSPFEVIIFFSGKERFFRQRGIHIVEQLSGHAFVVLITERPTAHTIIYGLMGPYYSRDYRP